jgi:hypothetical protein
MAARLYVLVTWELPREDTRISGPYPSRDAAEHAHITYSPCGHGWQTVGCHCTVMPVLVGREAARPLAQVIV